jgi:hypothetical protein
MNIRDAQSVVRILERQIRGLAREVQIPVQTIQPVLDELTRTRLSLTSLNREIAAETDENTIAAEMIISALAIIRSALILPAAFMEHIAAQADTQRYDHSAFFGPGEYEGNDVPIAMFQREEFNTQQLGSIFNDLVSGVNRYIRESDYPGAALVTREIEQYFSGEGEER